MDETGLNPSFGNSYVIAQKGQKSVKVLTSEIRDHLTIVAYASAEGYSGNPFFILAKKVNNFLGSRFPGSKFSVSASGYMNDAVFEEWCEFLIDDLRPRRQAPHLWRLLVLDSLHSHTLNPKALQILSSANILAVSLPSHTSNFLQVHDLSIFGPLKKYFRSSISTYGREKGIQIKLENLPEILEEPWVLANNSLNIKKGFQKAGIWPLNTNWVEENFETIKHFKKKNKEDQLEELNETRLLNGDLKSILEGLDYLDLASKPIKVFSPPIKCPMLSRTLSSIISNSRANLKESVLRKTAPRKNCLGEFYEDAKILNDQERIEALKIAINLRNEKKLNQHQKKNQASSSNQETLKSTKTRKHGEFTQSQQSEIEEEINYKKMKFTQ